MDSTRRQDRKDPSEIGRSEVNRIINLMTAIPGVDSKANLSRLLGLEASTIYQWRHRGRIPLEYLPILVKIARKHKHRLRLSDLNPYYQGVS